MWRAVFGHEEQVEGGPAQKEDESDSESTELAEMLHGFPRTPQSLVPDAYKPLLPWGSCTAPVSSPQIPCIAYTSPRPFLLLTPRRTSTGPSAFHRGGQPEQRGRLGQGCTREWQGSGCRSGLRTSSLPSLPFQALSVNLVIRPGRF